MKKTINEMTKQDAIKRKQDIHKKYLELKKVIKQMCDQMDVQPDIKEKEKIKIAISVLLDELYQLEEFSEELSKFVRDE